MNAYELAEQLMTALATLENSAIMLRQLQKEKDQQADRIAELEKEKIRAYGNGFEDGQKSLTTNAEPVAWAVYDHEFECYRFFHLKEENSIPLYTTPQLKPLSDEEIVEIYESVKQDKDLTWEEWCITWEEWCKEQIEFARAIEERHGIK